MPPFSSGATFAIGDLHGCAETLDALWRQLPFDPTRDQLWLVGDLVNRGPNNLAVLRWARAQAERLGSRFVAVLGNHDIHLLARALGLTAARRRDTLDDVLAAVDREELIGFLLQRPLLHPAGNHVLVHAGVLPAWTLEEAVELAADVAKELIRGDRERLITDAWRAPLSWSRRLKGRERRAFALATLTRLRTVNSGGDPFPSYSGPPELAPAGTQPWFDHPDRRTVDTTVVCGHWAALGLRLQPGLAAIDTACVWGQHLTALRIEDGTLWQQPALEAGLTRGED